MLFACKSRALYGDEQYDLHLRFLAALNMVPEASDIAIPKQMSNAKHRCVNNYDIKGTRIFRKLIWNMYHVIYHVLGGRCGSWPTFMLSSCTAVHASLGREDQVLPGNHRGTRCLDAR